MPLFKESSIKDFLNLQKRLALSGFLFKIQLFKPSNPPAA